MQQMRLEHRREQVVRGADRVDVAREVEVHVLHRHDLRVAGPRGSALDPEHRPERRLAQAEERLAADRAEALGERDGRRRLALAELRRRDRGDADELRVRAVGEPLEHGERDLCLVGAVEIELVGLEPRRCRDLGDRPELGLLCDLERRRCCRRHARCPFYNSAWDTSNISVVDLAADRAYVAIRGLIVSLELPPGAVIDERELMRRIGLGRTPVREALRKLAQEQLVEVFPRRGMFVTGVDVRDLARISEVRTALEPEAARLAAERATDEERDELASLSDAIKSGADLMGLDERIHRAIYAAAHNDLMEKTLGEYYVLALRIWMIALDRAEDLEEAVEAHRDLITAIVVADGDRAADLMRDHVENFERAMREVLVSV